MVLNKHKYTFCKYQSLKYKLREFSVNNLGVNQSLSRNRPGYPVHGLLYHGPRTVFHVLNFLPESDILLTVLGAQENLKLVRPLLVLHQIEEADGPLFHTKLRRNLHPTKILQSIHYQLQEKKVPSSL